METNILVAQLLKMLYSDGSLFAKECAKSILEDTIILNSGISLNKEHAFETYKHRYEVQRDVTHADVLGYNELLDGILRYTGSTLRILTISIQNYVYAIFCDNEITFLIGILKSPYSNFSKNIASQSLDPKNIKLLKGIVIH